MPTFDEMYAYLKEHYLHSRFAGRDTKDWAADDGTPYSNLICRSAIKQLEQTGEGFIGPYEAASGRIVRYNSALQILNPDAPREQIGKRAGSLTHIYGQSF